MRSGAIKGQRAPVADSSSAALVMPIKPSVLGGVVGNGIMEGEAPRAGVSGHRPS
jgi:hypothetical protein